MSSQVGINLDPGPFYGGKNLSGTVSITVNGVQEAFSYLVVQVYVASTVCIHRDDFFSSIGKGYEKYDVNSEPIERRHHQQIYINNHTVFHRPQTLASGTYPFRFETKLPEDLPPNAVDQVTNKSFGRIDFTATAKLGVVTGGEIVATAAFEYIPHMYVHDPRHLVLFFDDAYFPFSDRIADYQNEYEHPHSLPSPTLGEMRELLKNEPKGKLHLRLAEPWCQMRQDQGNDLGMDFSQNQAFSPLWVEVSQLHLKEAVTLTIENFKIMHLTNKCSVPHPGVRLQGKSVHACFESINPSVPLVPSFYSLNYRHTYILCMRIKICRQFMGKHEVYDDFITISVDVLSPYVTQRKRIMSTLGKRPVITRPDFCRYAHYSDDGIMRERLTPSCICQVEARYITDEPEITHTHQ